eukprot:NODE_5914_length_594_cov_25.573876_g5749_i0.p1 GENE.NODE_5914_length_594_cov_25.573876_g5749_i0~~NODE_5914_length_594_cov_25.573876_g5749_i0.p1  ORF type:complete len:149 (-),score=27.97 NODE_5914_length_594_cov_25.573876_g5749_i0:82-528(-)
MSKACAFLAGHWKGMGKGYLPGREFTYVDELVITPTGPLLEFVQRTCIDDKPMHKETGYIRPSGSAVAFLVTHVTGMTEISEGQAEPDALTVTSHSLGRMEASKEPKVTAIHRRFWRVGDILNYEVKMSTSTTPTLTKHLTSQLQLLP